MKKQPIRFAILAAGHIAESMARTVTGLPKEYGLVCYAVASRTLNKAEDFAARWGFQKAYGSYEELVQDEEVDLVYVASPHSHHYAHTKLCIEHGKNVLVEKAFTVNAKQAKELIDLAKERNVLLAEAIWTRYMPARKMINEMIENGLIGEPVSITANLGYPMRHKERLQEPSLAGGALLDVGVYPINFAMMVFGHRISEVEAWAVMSPKGVDYTNSVTLLYEDGKLAILHSSMLSPTDRQGMIYGEAGYIRVENINNPERIIVYNPNHQVIAEYAVPEQITGYEYEVLECMECIRRGKLQCESMPWGDTMDVMRLLDTIRGQWGMVYPCEEI